MIRNIPHDLDIDYDDELKPFLEENLFADRKAIIKELNLAYNLKE